MPHRILSSTCTFVGALIEAVLIGVIGGWKLCQEMALALTEQDWSRLVGPHGFTVGLILAVIVLWGNGVADRIAQRKRDALAEENREKRHTAQLALQQQNSEKLIELQTESIEAKIHMTTALNGLASELRGRPCGIGIKPIKEE